MKKDSKIILTTIILMIAMGIYKPLISLFLPNISKDIATLTQKSLQALTIIFYTTTLGLWSYVGNITKLTRKGMILVLPVGILSLIPILNGITESKSSTIFISLLITSLIGINEEFIFRGIILSALRKNGRLSSIITSSIIFGLFHLLNLVYGADIIDTVVQVVFATGFGLVMAVTKYETGEMLSPIIIHALWDFISKISNADFLGSIDIIHTISIVLVVVWGIFLTFRVTSNNTVSYSIDN